MRCLTCMDTGIDFDGNPCTDCVSKIHEIKTYDDSIIPAIYRKAVYLEESCSNESLLRILKNFNTTSNYILQGKDNTGKQTFVYTIMRKLLSEGKTVLPVILPLHINGVLRAISLHKEYEYSDETVINYKEFRNSDILVLRINSTIDKLETSNIKRLIEYRETYSKGIIITTQKTPEDLGLSNLGNFIIERM